MMRIKADVEETDDLNDCLHCLLWRAISAFYREHPPSENTGGPLKFIADVGDELASAGATPLREELIDTINRRIKDRIAFRKHNDLT